MINPISPLWRRQRQHWCQDGPVCCHSLTWFYEVVLKVPCVCRRPQPKIIERLFVTKLCRFLPHPALGPILGRRPAGSCWGGDGARTPGRCRTTSLCQASEGCQGRWQGWRMNKPVCACISVSACTIREISAFSKAKFQAQNPAGQQWSMYQTYQYVPAWNQYVRENVQCTALYFHELPCTDINCLVLPKVRTGTYSYVFLVICLYRYVPECIAMRKFPKVRTGMYYSRYVL